MAYANDQESKLVHLLNELIELDLDAVEAYEAAVVRLNDVSDKAQLERFMVDHRRHTIDLTALVQAAGGTPATSPDFKRVLTKGKVVLMGVAGDVGVLDAMRSNEEGTTKAYDKATRHPELTLQARSILERNYADEKRHLGWIEQRLAHIRREKDAVRHA